MDAGLGLSIVLGLAKRAFAVLSAASLVAWLISIASAKHHHPLTFWLVILLAALLVTVFLWGLDGHLRARAQHRESVKTPSVTTGLRTGSAVSRVVPPLPRTPSGSRGKWLGGDLRPLRKVAADRAVELKAQEDAAARAKARVELADRLVAMARNVRHLVAERALERPADSAAWATFDQNTTATYNIRYLVVLCDVHEVACLAVWPALEFGSTKPIEDFDALRRVRPDLPNLANLTK